MLYMADFQKLIVVLVALICVISFQPHPAYAQEASHALIMHGEPKYGPDFKHLSYANPYAPKGGHLREPVVGSFDNLNNHIILGEPAKGLALTYDTLMQRVWDEPFGLYGLVAETVEVPEDRSSITYNLNPDARFHDGHPITAEDVVFSYEAYLEHGHPVRRRVYGFVNDVDIINDHKVKFTFGDGADSETPLILSIMPVLPKHYWADKDISKTTLTPPLGSGPYKISAVDTGRKITYDRVPDYWGKDLSVNRGLYNFDKVTYVYYRDADIALEAFKAGETSIKREYDIAAWNTSYNAPRIDSGDVVKREYAHARPERVRAFIFNTRRAPLNDVRVREAMTLALDAQRVNDLFYDGKFNRIKSYFPNSELAYSGAATGRELEILQYYRDELPKRIFTNTSDASKTDDVRRARLRRALSLLKASGYEIRSQQLVNTSTGKPVVLEVLLTSSADEKIALFYKEALQRLGITLNIRTVDAAQFTGRLDQFDYDIVLYQWVNSLSPGNEQMNYWGSAAAENNGSRNYAGTSSPVIDQLAMGIGASKTRDELVAYTHALDRVLINNFYSIPLFYLGADLIAHDANLHSVETTPMYGTVLESWWYDADTAGN